MKGNLDNITQSYYLSPLGCLKITQRGDVVTQIVWHDQRHELEVTQNKLLISWLDGFFNGQCQQSVDFAIEPQGTLFQQRVWFAMAQIPLGQTQTYGDIAKALGSSAQAVGNACRQNQIVVAIPCHRVVSANGDGGYAGQTAGVMMKRKLGLLALEVGVDPKEINLESN